MITTAGIGPLTLGGNQTSQAAKTLQSYTKTAPAYACPVNDYSAREGRAGPPLTTEAVTNDTINLIMIGALGTTPAADSPQTPSGIGLGATQSQLLATYPHIEDLTVLSSGTGTFGHAYGIEDAQGRWLSFVLDENGRVGEIDISYTKGKNGEFC